MATIYDLVGKTLWILITTHVRPSSTKEFCPLDSYNCSQFGVKCTILRDPDCSRVADMNSHVKHYPGPVTNLSISPYYLQPDNAVNSISRVEITWGLPQNDTHKYLTGVEVRLNWGENTPYCFVFNISVGEIGDDASQHFVLNCLELRNDGYSVNVTSLPDTPYSDLEASAMLNIIRKHRDKPDYNDKCRNSNASLCWDTDIVVYNEACTRTVRVVFSQAPQGYGIEYYRIDLLNNKNFTIASANVSRVQDPGSPLLTGTIDASVIQLPLINGSIRVIPRGNTCSWNNCRDSASHPFNIWPATITECTFLGTPDSTTSAAVIGIIVTVVAVIVGLVMVIIVVVARSNTAPCHKAVPAATPNYESDVDSISSFGSSHALIRVPRTNNVSCAGMPKKIVYLLYSDDNPAHINVINCLDQLFRYKNYQTIFFGTNAEIINLTAWVKQAMQNCDYILLINSEGTYQKTRRFITSHQDGVSNLGDMFTVALGILTGELSHLIPKLIMCHFEYTADQFIRVPLSLFKGQANYPLAAHMDDLFRHMDSSTNSTNVFVPECELSSGEHFLDNAIQQATNYIRNNPGWSSPHNVEVKCMYPELPGFREYTLPNCDFREPVNPDDITTVDGSTLEGLVYDINRYGQDH